MIIVLDPGHGEGYNQSPVNPAYKEGTRMWEYSWILKKELESAGITVYTTREKISDNPSLSDRGYFAGRTKKADLLISLHSNAPGSSTGPDGKPWYDPSVRGMCCVPTLREDCKVSRRLADAIADALGKLMGNGVKAVFTKESDTMPGWDWYGILKYSMWYGCKHALIVEHGFHTNYEDSQWLLDDTNLLKMAQVETAIICNEFGIKYTPKIDYAVGDVNLDGKIDISDITELLDLLGGRTAKNEEQFRQADLNKDGKIDILDITQLNNILANQKNEKPTPVPAPVPEEKKVSVELTQVKKGSKCPEVFVIQTILNAKGYKDSLNKMLTTDGDFGTNTDYAVRAFQKEKGLTVDGIVGEKTYRKLLAE